ncbi:hypothetical protein [Nannocystis pusilla]|uniref:Myxococcus cysteine-rich repeat-containing protein n=1 Tax=Nannocystis pusilla TaxID=889268 RepID=A0ABS7TJ06_9BACT|nr:hypothetical protein [Nannocystis pusilla]MBZ5708209.1 hypothetical protein [Nannocystis pusilla]
MGSARRICAGVFVLAQATCVEPQAPGASTATTSTGEPATTEAPPDEPDTTSTTDVVEPTTTTTTTSGDVPTTGAPGPMCGDGVIDPGETCDLGADNSNNGACTMMCHPAVCGDGLLWIGEEACDFGPGNVGSYGGCTPECELAPYCGDGDVDAGHEECDLAALNGTGMSLGEDAACSAFCGWVGRIGFVTSAVFDGALGGLSGADLQCINLAEAAGLANADTFRAWLSDGVDSPLTRFEQIELAGVPYVLLSGRVIADDFAELVTDGPRTGISMTELGTSIFQKLVWTNTDPFGEVFSASEHCSGWTVADPGASVRIGMNAPSVEAGPEWDAWQQQRHWTSALQSTCHKPRRLYCFEDGWRED